MNTFMFTLPLLVHFLIGFYFVFFGFWNVYHWAPLLEVMAKKNIPHPYVILAIGIVWQVLAGFLIIFDLFVKIAASSLIVFTVISVFIFYPFWNFKGEHRNIDVNMFVANMTVTLGALLALIAGA